MACAYLKKFLAFLQHSEISAADILPHSEGGFEEEQHCASEGFHSDFFLQFLPIKFCILKSCWNNVPKWVSERKISKFFIEIFLQTLGFFIENFLQFWVFLLKFRTLPERKKKNLLLPSFLHFQLLKKYSLFLATFVKFLLYSTLLFYI